MRGVWADVRHALRQWRQAPVVTVLGAGILAWARAPILRFSRLLDALVLRAVAVPRPQRLVAFSAVDPSHPDEVNLWSLAGVNAPAERQRVFDAVAACLSSSTTIEANGTFAQAGIAFVSAAYFHVLEVPPALGRLIDADDVRKAGRVAVISDAVLAAPFVGQRWRSADGECKRLTDWQAFSSAPLPALLAV